MGAILNFLYGWMTGIVAVVLCILYGFDTLLFVMRLPRKVWSRLPFTADPHEHFSPDAADALPQRFTAENKAKWLETARQSKQSLREQGLEGVVAGAKPEAAQLKLASTCFISWYDDGISGAPVRCRLVLTGSDLTVSELLPSAGQLSNLDGGAADGADRKRKTDGGKGRADGYDRDVSSAEHLRGVTDVCRLHAKLIKSVAKDKSRPNNPFNGRILVLTTLDNQPVVGPRDATGVFTARATGAMGAGDASSNRGLPKSPANGSLAERSFADDKAEGEEGVNPPSVGTTPLIRPSGGAFHARSSRGAENVPAGATTLSRRGMSGWTSVVIKFRDNRETERWHNVLSGLEQAAAWRDYVKTLPNPDTANTLISRFLFQNMQGEGLAKAITKLVQKKLKKVSITKFPRDLSGQILLDDFVIGKSIPWITDVSEPTVSTNGEFGFNFNLHYKAADEGFTLFFRLALAYRDIRIPHVTVALKLHELEGTVHVSIGPPPSKKFWIAGCQPPALRVEVHQGCAIGHGLLHRILTSLPDLSGIITNLLKLFFISQMVLPYMDDFPIPNFENTPKGSQSATPKTRVFDRKRAAQKSAAPDLSSATPATSVNTTAANAAPAASADSSLRQTDNNAQGEREQLSPTTSPTANGAGGRTSSMRGGVSGVGESPEAPPSLGISGLRPLSMSASAGSCAASGGASQSRAAARGEYQLPSTLAGASGSGPIASPTGLSLWASAVRRGGGSGGGSGPGAATLASPQALGPHGVGNHDGASGGYLSLRSGDGYHAPTPANDKEEAGASAGAAAAARAAGAGGSSSPSNRDAEETATVTSSGREPPDGTCKARRNKLANLRSALKTKGVDMDRAAVAKADV